LEHDERGQEQDQAAVLCEVPNAHDVVFLRFTVRVAGAGVVNLLRSDEAERDQSGTTKQGCRDEDCIGRNIVSGETHCRRGQGMTGCGIAVIATGAQRYAAASDQPETDRAYCRRDNTGSNAMKDLGERHSKRGWHQGKDQGGDPDHGDPDSGQSSLPADHIGQRASGNLGEYSCKTSESEGKADLGRRPTKVS